MIPVSLRLKNFMSYGAEAPVLDFEQFQIACLSGRNGQGKSALLDAITWSLWGEARKSSGTQKPDDELLRTGTREMQVEFVFDIEGERYRVVRTYSRSATGKTNKSQLELHLLEAAQQDYRPLTGASLRETQSHIDAVVGLDYDTFINSAFLLQGRSDEFTKKRPSERKEILARILNLSRYDALYDLAAERERDARKAEEQATLDVERLEAALGEEPAWKARHDEVKEEIEEARIRLDALRTEEKCLTERLADLDARAREAETVRQHLDALARRLAAHEQDLAGLREKIARAEALIDQREVIQRDHERYQTLQKERDELDAKNELFRGIEKQLERREAELKDKKKTLESDLYRLDLERQNLERQLAECEAELAEKPSVVRRLEQAQAARAAAEALSEKHQQRTALEGEMRGVEQTLVGKREALQSQIDTREAQYRQGRQNLPNIAHLKDEESRLEKEVARREQLQATLEETTDSGKAVGEILNKQAGVLSAKREELAQVQEQQARLGAEAGGQCPVCGTTLTPEHQQQVRAEFAERLATVQREIQTLDRSIDQQKQKRDALRATFSETKSALDALADVPKLLDRVRRERERAEAEQQELDQQQATLESLRVQLSSESYAADERRRLDDLRRRHAAIDFDAERYERLRDEAAQATHLEERLRRLEEAAGRRQQLDGTLARKRQETDALRKTLDDGSALRPIQQQIQQLTSQLETVGFDAQRFREVKQQLDALKDAGSRMTALVNAQQSHAEWKATLADVEQRAAQTRADRDAETTRLADIEAALAGRETVEAQRKEKSDACRAAEAALHELQMQLGQLQEKLRQAERDRALLRTRHTERADARRQRGLYKHLKAAFSKHGIPSLIIEQTLPEIEDRTNDLLDRLTDGRMHIRLETLKDKKTGGTKETLEIKITDEQGVSRPYETYSGGEAFRVNFALRIALAQLLAERSGVRVRTLVVDEGFGTQDAQGVQNLVEAIQTIQDDFDKILVITHLPSLKEVFPVRIEVEKDPVEGSRFEMIGV